MTTFTEIIKKKKYTKVKKKGGGGKLKPKQNKFQLVLYLVT